MCARALQVCASKGVVQRGQWHALRGMLSLDCRLWRVLCGDHAAVDAGGTDTALSVGLLLSARAGFSACLGFTSHAGVACSHLWLLLGGVAGALLPRQC